MPPIKDDRMPETDMGCETAETDDESSSDGTELGDQEDLQQSVSLSSVDQRLEEIVKSMRDGERQWKDITEVERRGLLGRTTNSSGPTALHILADEKPNGKYEFSGLKDLVEYLVTFDQESMLQVNENSGYTPLHFAIYHRNRAMVKWICAACNDIDAVLKKKGTKLKRNCIHLAIDSAKSGKDKTARSLVDLASAETLTDKDEEGNTPLALAVDYKRCKEGQIRLIEAIVERSDYYIREDPERDFNNEDQSPYMYHLATAKKVSAAAEAAKDLEEPKTAVAKPVPLAEQQQKRPEPGQRPLLPRANSAATMAHTLRARPGDAMGKTGLVLYGRDGPEHSESVPVSKTAIGVNLNHANEIRRFLKKHYLRSRDQDVALKILYDKDPISEKAISFDLSGHKSLTTSEIKQHISILDFETILQYVDIPIICSNEQPSRQKSRGPRSLVAAQKDGDGRTDAQTVFELLRKKGIETILEVAVDDLEHPAHSDLAIEKALCGEASTQNMNIETWNWKKVDISPDLIYKVASNASFVQLYWSGNNAVLRAWSEEEGLPKLAKLRDVTLNILKGCLEPDQRIEENIKAFRERLNKHVARARASEIMKELQGEVDKQFGNQSSGRNLQDGVRERMVETGKEFNDALQNELAKEMASIFGANTETPKHTAKEARKTAVDTGKQRMKTFASAERKVESDGDIYAALKQAKQRARMRAKATAAEIASPDFGLNIKVCYQGGSHRAYNNTGQSADGEEPQRDQWIQCMTDFRRLLYKAEKSFCNNNDNREHLKKAVQETGGPITVALIDDGIDMAKIQFDNSIDMTKIQFDESIVMTGKSFAPRPSERSSDKITYFPWYISSGGHSTVMATQIHHMAPKANLCFLKLHDSVDTQSNKRRITIKSAAQAIREATRRKVHIISMSWTITPPSSESESERQDQKDLESAINEAWTAGILMFCSASDEGANYTATFPSKARPGHIFKIGGADANGGLYHRVGDIAWVDYILPAQAVTSEYLADTGLSTAGKTHSSGSSVATALAAGLAALILYCAQIRFARARTEEKEATLKEFHDLRRHDKMKGAFDAIVSVGKTDKYPAVWGIFGKKVEESNKIRHSRQSEPIDHIADVARQLCRF